MAANRRGKIDEFYDLSALEDQHRKVLAVIGQFVDTVSGIKPILVKMEGAEKIREVAEGMKQTAAATERMITVTGKAVDETGKLVDISTKVKAGYKETREILEKYTGTLEQNISLNNKYKLRLDEIAKTLKEQKKAYDEQRISLETYREKVDELTKEQIELKTASSELMQTIKSQVKEQQAAATSYDETNQVLGRMRDTLRQLSEEERNSPFGQVLAQQVVELDAKLKAQDAAMGNYQRNVGNYAGAFSAAFDTLKQELQAVQQQINGGDFKGEALDALKRQEALLTEITIGLGQEFKSTRAEARAFQEAAAKLGISLGQDSKAFQVFRKEVGEGVDSIADIKDSIKLAASDTQGLDRIIGAAQGLAGAWGAAAGAAELFGLSEGEAAEATKKFAAIMTVLSGLQAVQAELTNKDSLLRKVATRAQNLWNKAMVEGAAASNALKIALTGGLLLLLPLIAVAAGKIAEKIDDLGKRSRQLADINKRAAESVSNVSSQLADLKTKVDLARKGVLDKKDVLKEYNEGLGKVLGNTDSLNKAEQLMLDKGPALIEMMFLKAKAAAAGEMASEATKKALQAENATVSESLSGWEKAGLAYSAFFRSATLGENPVLAASRTLADANAAAGRNRKEIITKSNSDAKDYLALQEKFTREAAALAKKAKINFFDNGDKPEEKSDQGAKNEAARRKALFEIQKQQLQDRIANADQVAQAEASSFNQRLQAEQAFYDYRKQLLDKQKAFDLQEAQIKGEEEKKTAAQIAADKRLIEAKYNSDIVALNTDSENRITAQLKANADKRKANREKEVQDMVESDEEAFAKRMSDLEEEAQAESKALLERYKTGKISKEKYEADKLEIENKFRRKSLEEEIKMYELILKLSGLSADQRKAFEEKLRNVRKQLNKEEEDGEKKKADTIVEINRQKNEKLKELAAEVKETVFAFLTAGIEREKNAIQEQMDANEQKKNKDIEVANQTIANADQRERAIKEIEVRAAAQKEQLERRRRKLDEEKARYDRIKTIADIIQSTSLAVVKTLAEKPGPAGIALAAIIGVIGALQLARAIATPIPKYATGTEHHPGGLAVVGDGGKSEYAVTPGGDVVKTPDTATVMDLPAGTKVFKDERTFLERLGRAGAADQLNALRATDRAIEVKTAGMERVMRDGLNKIAKSVKPRPAPRPDNGFRDWVHKN